MRNRTRGRRPATRWQIGLWILLVCFYAGVLPVWGQAHVPPKWQTKLTAKTEWTAENITFDQALQRMHKQHGLNLLASGGPLRATANLQVVGTVADALDALALAFDYQWAMDNQGMVLLSKAFRNQEDFPQMNLAEVRRITNALLKAVENAPSNPEMLDTEKNKLIQSLTPQQWNLLRTDQALAGQWLSEAQRRQCQQIALTQFLSYGKYHLTRSFELYSQLEQSEICVTDVKRKVVVVYGEPLEEVTRTVLQIFSPKSRKIPFFEFFSNTNSEPLSNPLSKPQSSTPPRIQDPLYFSEIRGRVNPEGTAERWSQNVAFLESRITLGKLLSLMSVPNQLTFRADDAQKPLLLHIYCADVSRMTLTKAIATLEDWHWYESKTGAVEFVPRSLRETADIQAIPRRIQAALPRELRDYLGTRRPPLFAHPTASLSDGDDLRRSSQILDRSLIMSRTALQELFAAFSTPERKGKRFVVSQMSNAERQWVAWVFSEMQIFSGSWLRDFPPYLSNPQTLQIKRTDGGLRFSAKYSEQPNLEASFDIEVK